jgi:hypothetical protein
VSSIKEKINKKRYRVIKEEYFPYRENVAVYLLMSAIIIFFGWVLIYNLILRGLVSQTGVSSILLGLPVFCLVTILIIVSIIVLMKDYRKLFTLEEVVIGDAVQYMYEDKKTKRKTYFESFSDAEMAIEDPGALKQEP